VANIFNIASIINKEGIGLKRRFFFMMLVMVMVGSCFTGYCKSPQKVEFWYSLGGDRSELVQGMIKKFNDSQQDVIVKGIFQGNYYDTSAKIQATIAAGSPPALAMLEISSIGLYADAGALENLSPYIKRSKGMNVKNFIPGLMDYSYWNKKLIALPFNRSTPLFFFNKKQFQEAGLNPNGPKTWKDLEQYAKKLSIPNKRWGYSCPIDVWFYAAMVFQNGGEMLASDHKHIGFKNKAGLEPLNFWRRLIDEDAMKVPPGKEYNSWDVAKNDFINETVSMIVVSTGDASGLVERAKGKFEVGTCFLPKAKQYGVPTGGANLVMFAKKSKEEKAAAWKFMKWITDTEQTIYFSQRTGYMPSCVSAVKSAQMLEYFKDHPQFKTAIDQLQYAKRRPMHPNYPQLNNVIMNEIQKAVLNRSYAPEKALQTIDEAAVRLIK
jgi:sn-glycerol 3-phosphate transport system substrate-binding protein